MIAQLHLMLLFFSVGCASKLPIQTMDMGASMCLNGMLRQWEQAGCTKVLFEQLEVGYERYWCAESSGEENPLLSQTIWVVRYLPQRKQYAKALDDDMVPQCGDPYSIVVHTKPEKNSTTAEPQ